MADELISRQAAISKAFEDMEAFRAAQFQEWLDELPAVDAVEVVRCKDCIRRYDLSECPMHFLSEDGYSDYTADDGYCDRGERREENAAD